MKSKGKAIAITLSNDEFFYHESSSNEDSIFITFTTTDIVDESVVIEENPFDGELSECSDLQEAFNKLCKVAAKDAMSVDLGLKKIVTLELEKKKLVAEFT